LRWKSLTPEIEAYEVECAAPHRHCDVPFTEIDWLVIAAYFGVLLCVAWWVVRKGKDSAADNFQQWDSPRNTAVLAPIPSVRVVTLAKP
jgi:hypothetical protein